MGSRYRFSTGAVCAALLAILVFGSVLQAQEEEEELDFLLDLSLEELANRDIVSASNIAERLADAPARVIVISREEIEQRGYADLVEIFSDLPGIDVAITYGDLYFRPYWRGFRKGSSSTFLFMIDGVIMNHLWFNWTDIMVAVPLSNIENVEVVYGPASSVYGPNALMGVVNVITRKDREQDGTAVNARFATGSFDTRVADMNFLYKRDDLRVSLTGLLNKGDLDTESLESFEYTKPEYLGDRSLWGGFLDNPSIAGTVGSPRENIALMANLFFGDAEIGAQYFHFDSGYGLNYAYDKMQPGVWIEDDYSLYFRHSAHFSERIASSSLIRYRRSDVPNASNSLEGFGDASGERGVRFGFWQSLNSSWSAFQDFDVSASENLTIKTGLKYESKDLQKAYDLPYGPFLPPAQIDAATYPYPDPPVAAPRIENRANWIDQGIYVQTKYRISSLLQREESHFLNLGVRYDDNSFYGSAWTMRAGYVGHFGRFSAKVLYGEAIQEPTPRQLYGGWAGSGSSPDLNPEESRTLEFYVDYTREDLQLGFNPYRVRIDDSIMNLTAGPVNLGQRDIFGFDLHGCYQLQASNELRFKLWAYYSFADTEEQKFTADDKAMGKGIIGDIADHKIYFGATGMLREDLSATLRGRFIGARTTVETNPVRKVDSYFTADLNIVHRNFFARGVGLTLKLSNIFDAEYFHPGIRDASTGDTPGFWDEDGIWRGSAGWSNSLLPQPGRQAVLALTVSY